MKLSVENLESDSGKVISQAKELAYYDSDEEIKGDNIVQYSDSSRERSDDYKFIDIFLKDSTLISPEVTPVITEFVDIFSENPLDNPSPKRDIQHAIESDSE